MPRFLGLFSRKSKNADPPPQSSTPSDDLSNVSISPTVSNSTGHDRSLRASLTKSHRHADSTRSAHAPATPAQADRSSVYPSITSSPSAASTASSSKLRLPFSRKRQPPPAAATSTTSVNTAGSQCVAQRDCHSAPRPPFVDRERTSTASDGDLTDSRRLRPPPSKSAIFAAYADPQGTLSTRSLPNEAPQPFSLPDSGMPSLPSDYSPQPLQAPGLVSAPKKSFFSWGRSPSPAPVAKTKSKSTSPSQPVQDPKADSGVEVSNSSFNLKSFRHVGPSSPLDSQASLSVPSSSPLPRPRGTSVGDSSQRISVAAFREAQARRSSMVDSPVPSLRSSSPLGTPPTPQEPGGRASPRLGPPKSSISHDARMDGTNRGLDSDSDADSSSSEEDSDGESDRERTLTQRDRWKGKAKAKSEMGHGILRSENMDMPSRPQSNMAQHATRQRASMSTSAATPSAAAKRASILVNTNDPSADYTRNSRHVREPSVYSNLGASTTSSFSPNSALRQMSSSDSEEEEDAPLASLVPPKRPGSALSSGSGSSLPGSQIASSHRSNSSIPLARGKPLIDINEILGAKTSMAEERGFTQGKTLLATSTNASPSGTKNPGLIKTSRLSASPPPLSPTESITSSGFATAPSSIKATSFGQMSPSNSNSEQAAPRRDGLNERLLRAAKGSVARVTSPVPFTSPLAIPDVNPPPNADDGRRTAFPRTPRSPRTSFGAPQNSGFLPSRPTELSGLKMSPSPPDQELIEMLGASVKLISKTGDSSPEDADTQDSSEDEEESDDDVSLHDDDKGAKSKNSASSPQISEKGTDEWEKVDLHEAKGKEEFKGKEGILKGKNVLRKERGKRKEGSQDLTPKVSEPPIAPIPIKQRTPTPSFSVTSRPPLVRGGGVTSTSGSGSTSVAPSSTASSGSLASSSSGSGSKTRQRSNTVMNPLSDVRGPSVSAAATSETRGRSAGLSAPALRSPAMSRASGASNQSGQDSPSNTAQDSNRSSIADHPANPSGVRPRSTTMMPSISSSPVPGIPIRPFARRESPASSTGDSSSGRAPLTPRDGSDIGSTGGSALGAQAKSGESNSAMKGSSNLRSTKRRSVCFEDDLIGDAAPPSVSGRVKTVQKDGREGVDEEKRKERRRSEAKAAIELGNVINGRGPIVDDEEEDMPVNQSKQARMSNMNMMMGMGGGMHPMQMGSMPSWNGPWGNPMGQMYNGSQYMLPQGPPDPTVIAAHQQAMMIAKQAYQMAVAQQAAAAAGDEWERGSAAGGFGGRSMFGGGMPNPPMTPYGMGMGGMGGMNGMGGMGMGMNMNMNMMGMGSNWSTAGSAAFPPSARSMYGGMTASKSEYGGSTGGPGWNSSRSTYGEAFGPPTGRPPKPGMAERDSNRVPPVPPIPIQAQTSSSAKTSGGRTRTTSQPSSTRSGGQRKIPPPSSWKGS